MTNKEITDLYIHNGLISKCVDYQFSRIKDKSVKQFKDDFYQDIIVFLYEYDNDKINNAHLNNHFNALVSRIIINNLYSTTSPFYTRYRYFQDKTDEITEQLKDTYGEV